MIPFRLSTFCTRKYSLLNTLSKQARKYDRKLHQPCKELSELNHRVNYLLLLNRHLYSMDQPFLINGFTQRRNLSTTRNLFNAKNSSTNHSSSQTIEYSTMNDSFSSTQDNDLKFDPLTSNALNTSNEKLKETVDLTNLDNADLIEITNQVVNYVNPTAIEIGLSQYFPPRIFYDILMYVHEHFNLSWASTIAICCLTFRTLTFPLYIKSKIESTNLINNQFKWQQSMNEFNKDPKAYQQAINDLGAYQSSVPRAMKSILVNSILFTSFYFALRAMAYHPIESLKNESFAWLPSLTLQDPYMLFPILIGGSMFAMLKYNMESKYILF